MRYSPERLVLCAVSFSLAGFIVGMMIALLLSIGTPQAVPIGGLLVLACLIEGIAMFKIMKLNEKEFGR